MAKTRKDHGVVREERVQKEREDPGAVKEERVQKEGEDPGVGATVNKDAMDVKDEKVVAEVEDLHKLEQLQAWDQ